MIAIGYMRRSGGRGSDVASLEEQAARIRAHCDARGWALAELVTEERSWWREGLVGLADLVRALDGNPRAERLVMPAEVLAGLEAEASETWARVRAWCQGRGIQLVAVSTQGIQP